MSASNSTAASPQHSTGSSEISLEMPGPQPKYYIPSFGKGEVEDVERYQPGGFHPVVIGDVINERLEITHKLGQGGLAIVWLCRDRRENRWCALKIMASGQSSEDGGDLKILKLFNDKGISREKAAAHHVMLPEEHFWIDGPNGRHLALLSPLLGPTLSYWLKEGDSLTFDAMHKFCVQMAESLKFLHGLGVCHGDFRPANILLKVRNIDDMSEDDICNLFQGPHAFEVGLHSGEENTIHAPAYVVKPAWWGGALDKDLVLDEIAIVDFGESFPEGQPPSFAGIPKAYAAPEIIYNHSNSLESDIWSLGASIMEVYGGSSFTEQVLPATKILENYFGPLPVEYREDFERQHREYLTRRREHEDMSERNLLKQGLSEYVGKKPKTDPSAWVLTEAQRTDPSHPVSYSSMSELEETNHDKVLKRGYSHPMSLPISYMNYSFLKETEPRYNSDGTWSLTCEEVLLLTDLALKIFRYNPEERLKPAQILKHPWLKEAGADEDTDPDTDEDTDESVDEDDDFSMGLGVVQRVMDLLWPPSWRYVHHYLV
ncbi:uncharacterized protein PG986_005240 [Apiospora aurea]|uniref:EKC/KEOPS complex subunit BUD32 n=1 Tax=Apiospora aurea TaxID=335848 RepID=A0ABR1QH09_9PEZI